MKTTRLIIILFLFFSAGYTPEASAQNWLKRLGKKMEKEAQHNVEQHAEKEIKKAIDNIFDIKEKKGKKKENKENTSIIEPPDTGTPAANTDEWDYSDPFHAIKKGTEITYTLYDSKNNVQNYHYLKIIDITSTKDNVQAVVSGTLVDKNGKTLDSSTVFLRYVDGNFHVDWLNTLMPKGLKNAEIETEISNKEILIPGKLSPGEILPDTEIAFAMKMKSKTSTADLPPIVFRIFNRRAIRAKEVETPAGNFVGFKIIQSLEANYPIIGKQLSTNITWIGKEVGTIKTESYDEKGKLTNRMLLTKLEQNAFSEKEEEEENESDLENDPMENREIVEMLYQKYKNSQISECKYNGETVYIVGLNVYDGNSFIFDGEGKEIGRCGYAWGAEPDPICQQLTDCEVIYRVKNNIWDLPHVNKYGLRETDTENETEEEEEN